MTLAGSFTLVVGMSALLGCRAGYVVKSAYFQGELLASRRPIDDVLEKESLKPEQRRALEIVADVKQWGSEQGFSSTNNYESIAWGWDRTIWNVTGCDPVAFEPKTWWFPIVGRFPYLGFFREEDARKEQATLKSEGLDTYVRTAGAYSTLGWFRDPILPSMMDWDEYDLADTVLHELAHATLWIPGSVAFNESFANFVGEQAGFQYLEAKHGVQDTVVKLARQHYDDRNSWSAVLHGVATDLATVYGDSTLSTNQKLARKAAIFASIGDRVRLTDFHDPTRYLAAAARTAEWNNARVIQYKVYNTDRESFERLLRANHGDVLAFIHAIQAITHNQDDPFAALASAASELSDDVAAPDGAATPTPSSGSP